MEIPPITIKFQTARAQHALELLANAALASPEIVKGIAKLESPLFDAEAREGDFQSDAGKVVEVAIFPTEQLRQFIRALGIDQPAIHRTR